MKHKIRFRYVVRWSEYVEVDIPDGATQRQIDDIVSAAEATIAYDPPVEDVDEDGWEWVGKKPVPRAPAWGDLPTIDVDGHGWRCDGWAAARNDAPPPTEVLDRATPVTADEFIPFLRRTIGAAVPESVPEPWRYHERYRALLEYADDRRWSGAALVLYRAGEPIGAVGPNSAGTLDAWGRPC